MRRVHNVTTHGAHLLHESLRLLRVCTGAEYQNYTLRAEVNHPSSDPSTQASETTRIHVGLLDVEKLFRARVW